MSVCLSLLFVAKSTITILNMGVRIDFIKIFGSSEEDEVSGFFVLSHLWMRGYFRLG